MKIHEYQAKKIFSEYNILVPTGKVAITPEEAELIATEIGAPVMIKAQILAGGRGKGGGIKIALTPAQAKEVASQILQKRLVTPQTSGEGILVEKILVEKKVKISDDLREIYLAFAINREKECPMIIACASGGMGIEEMAKEHSEKIIKALINPISGPRAFQIAFGLGINRDLWPAFFSVFHNLYNLFREKDCMLAEINPLVLTSDSKFCALDAKIVFDDNALFRHPELKELVDFSMENPLEAEAMKCGINYVKLDGNIGCVVNGAGLGMATMDRIFQLGERPANFLDIGGGAKPEQAEKAFGILFSDPSVKVILVNIFSGVLRVESFIAGLKRAIKEKNAAIPLVIRIGGDSAKDGMKALKKSGINFLAARTMDDGIRKAIKLLKAANGEPRPLGREVEK